MQKHQSLYLSDVVDASWQLPTFCWKWAVLCSAQTYMTSCVYTAYVKQIFCLHDWKYIETTCVPKMVGQVLLYEGCWNNCRKSSDSCRLSTTIRYRSHAVAYPGILFPGGVQQIQLTENRENGDLGAVAPLLRGSGGSCNLVQEISFHVAKIFLIFGTLRLYMTTNIYLSLLM